MIEVRIQHAWPGFDLDLAFSSDARVLGVCGPSGAGKSSLLSFLAGWQQPDSGLIRVGERTHLDTATRVRVPAQARHIAVVPQDPLLFPHLSTASNLAFAPHAKAELASERGQRMLDWLRLRPLLERRTQTLSGGEAQRVALGRAWLARPELVLLDEPAAALDAELAGEVLALLHTAKQDWAVPMVLVSHRSADLLALADDCLCIDSGRVQAQGPPRTVLAQGEPRGWSHGVENLLRLEVQGHDREAGLTWMALGRGQRIAIPYTDRPPGEWLHLGIRGEDLLLAQSDPGPTSARNALEATLEALTPFGREVLVDLRIDLQSMIARVTPGAVSSLGLHPGQTIHVLIKTTALSVLGNS